MTISKNIKEAFGASDDAADRGDLVQTVLIIAGFAVVAILLVTWIGNAIAGQAADVAECIAGANSYGDAAAAQDACETNENSQRAQSDNEASSGWQNRFG